MTVNSKLALKPGRHNGREVSPLIQYSVWGVAIVEVTSVTLISIYYSLSDNADYTNTKKIIEAAVPVSVLCAFGYLSVVTYKVFKKVFERTLETSTDTICRRFGTLLVLIACPVGMACDIIRPLYPPSYESFGISWMSACVAALFGFPGMTMQLWYLASMLKHMRDLSPEPTLIGTQGASQTKQDFEKAEKALRRFLIAAMVQGLLAGITWFVFDLWAVAFMLLTLIGYHWTLRQCLLEIALVWRRSRSGEPRATASLQ